MQLATFSYDRQRGFSVPHLPLQDSEQTLVLLFGARDYLEESKAIDEIASHYPHAKFMGCSSAGEIFDTNINDGSLAVAVAQFEKTDLGYESAELKSAEDSYEAGVELGEKLKRPDLKGVFILSDGLQVNGSELVRGLNSVLPKEVVITGGLAGDGDRFEKTWILKQGKPQSGGVTALAFYGDHIHLGHGSKGGWDIFGPERQVTKSKANVLYELDGKPALELYKKYLGELAKDLPASALLFPLALKTERQETVVRTVLSVDEAEQSLTFAGDIPKGSMVQLMRANFDRLVEGASEAATYTEENQDQQDPCLAIAISCVGRRLVLGERAEDEVEATLEVLPKATQQVGFYSYGEISPVTTGQCDLHNQTMTLTTLREV